MAIIWTQKPHGRGVQIAMGTDVHIRIGTDGSAKKGKREVANINFYDWAHKKYVGKYISIGYDPDKPNRLYFLASTEATDGFAVTNRADDTSVSRIPVRAINSAFGNTVRPNDLAGDYQLKTDVALNLNYIEFTR